MRKTLALISILLLTGCGNKIICKTENGPIEQKFEISYKEDEIQTIKTTKTYKFTDKEEFKSYESVIQYTVKADMSDNVTTQYKKKNKKYILIEKFNISKMNEEELKKVNMSRSKSEIIENFENSGLTCK